MRINDELFEVESLVIHGKFGFAASRGAALKVRTGRPEFVSSHDRTLRKIAHGVQAAQASEKRDQKTSASSQKKILYIRVYVI